MVQKRMRRPKHAEKEFFLIICVEERLVLLFGVKEKQRIVSSFHFMLNIGSVKNGSVSCLVDCETCQQSEISESFVSRARENFEF
jgi:hypothetical protein